MCAGLRADGAAEASLLERIRSQAELHAWASRLLPPIGHPSGADLPEGADGLLTALERTYAAVDGDRPRAQAAALRFARRPINGPPTEGHSGQPIDVRTLHADFTNPSAVHDERRLIGVVRPSGGCDAVLGDVAGPEWVALGGAIPDAARGTPVEVIGSWDEATSRFMCRSSSSLCQMPDYVQLCEAVDRLGEHRGLDSQPTLLRLGGRADLHPSVADARARRRIGEWERVLAAAEVLERAQADGPLTLHALAAAQHLVVPASTPRAGQLRQTPALIRWGGVVTFRAPPVADARRCTAHFLSALSDCLDDQGPTGTPGDRRRANNHPAVLAAQAVASIAENHPFADGNGRTARAVATWVLLRAGFRRRGSATLSTMLDDHLDEHFAALGYYRASPWAWHQLFADAVLTSFERAVTLNGAP